MTTVEGGERRMSSRFTVTGILDTRDAARAFRTVLAASGIALERVRLTLSPTEPDRNGEFPHPDHLRPRRAGRETTGRGACLVSVDVRSPRDRVRVQALMAAAGARQFGAEFS